MTVQDLDQLEDALAGDAGRILPLNVGSLAYDSSIKVKAGQGILYGFSVYNSNTSAQFIQVFDAQTLPADGAVPAVTFTVAASSNLTLDWVPGRAFYLGCYLCNSSTGPTKTIGSADCFFDVQYL